MGGWHMFLCQWWRTHNRDRNVMTGHGGLRGQSRKSTETHDFKIWIWYPKATGTNRDVVLLTSQPPCAGEKWRRRKIMKWRRWQAVRSSTRVQNLTIYRWVDAVSGHLWDDRLTAGESRRSLAWYTEGEAPRTGVEPWESPVTAIVLSDSTPLSN